VLVYSSRVIFSLNKRAGYYKEKVISPRKKGEKGGGKTLNVKTGDRRIEKEKLSGKIRC